jgi:MFS family permease
MITTRFGERRAMVGASLWAALAMLLCAFASDLVVFSAAVLMIGMSAAVFNLARLSWIAEAVPVQYRARALSTLGGVLRIGLFIGPFVAAAAIRAFGIDAAYGVGFVVLVAGAAVALSVAELPSHATSAGRAALRLREMLQQHRRVFATVGAGVVLIAAVRASRQAIVPLWADHIGLGAASVSLIYALSNAVDMLVFYPAGRRMDLRGRRAVAVPSMVIMGIALLAVPFTHSAAALLAAALLIGFGNGIASGLVMTLGVDHAPAHGRTQFLGVWRLLSDLGATGGPGAAVGRGRRGAARCGDRLDRRHRLRRRGGLRPVGAARAAGDARAVAPLAGRSKRTYTGRMLHCKHASSNRPEGRRTWRFTRFFFDCPCSWRGESAVRA